MGVCKPLMPDVVAPKAHQNNRSYVSSADLPSDSLRKILACGAVTQRTLKNHKTVKNGGWALARVWALGWPMWYSSMVVNHNCRHSSN